MPNTTYKIPLAVMKDTKSFLLSKGKEDKEAFVLWKGVKQGEGQYYVTGYIIPDQIALKTEFGYSFDIPQASIIKLNQELFNKKEIGLIQVHSHPGINTRHSIRDDKLSILNRLGALSIVLPNFGNVMFNDFSRVTVHVHTSIHNWEIMPLVQVDQVLKVV